LAEVAIGVMSNVELEKVGPLNAIRWLVIPAD
jgi:hypothetical protein